MLFKKELFVTRDAQRYQALTALLTEHGIACITANEPRTNPGRYRGMPFVRHDAALEYRIFVFRKDYEKAKQLIG